MSRSIHSLIVSTLAIAGIAWSTGSAGQSIIPCIYIKAGLESYYVYDDSGRIGTRPGEIYREDVINIKTKTFKDKSTLTFSALNFIFSRDFEINKSMIAYNKKENNMLIFAIKIGKGEYRDSIYDVIDISNKNSKISIQIRQLNYQELYNHLNIEDSKIKVCFREE